MQRIHVISSSLLALAAFGLARPQVSDSTDLAQFDQHELLNCEIDISPGAMLKFPKVRVYYEDHVEKDTNGDVVGYGARFKVTIDKNGKVAAADFDGNHEVELDKDSTLDLVFTHDTAGFEVDWKELDSGNNTLDSGQWTNTTARGTLEPLGPFERCYTTPIHHPKNYAGKTAVRVIFKNRGLFGGFVLYELN